MDNKQQNILSRLVIDGLDVRDKLNDLFNDIQNGDKDVKNLREELQSISFRLDASLENYDRHLQALEDARHPDTKDEDKKGSKDGSEAENE